MDVEWAIDGMTKELFIVQARPETVHSRKENDKIIEYKLEKTEERKTLCEGIAVGDKLGAGNVKIMFSSSRLFLFALLPAIVKCRDEPPR